MFRFLFMSFVLMFSVVSLYAGVPVTEYIDKKPPMGTPSVTENQAILGDDGESYTNRAKLYLWSENNEAFLHVEPLTQHFKIDLYGYTFSQNSVTILNTILKRSSDDEIWGINVYTPTTYKLSSDCDGLDFTESFTVSTPSQNTLTYNPTDASAVPEGCSQNCTVFPTAPVSAISTRISDAYGNEGDISFWVQDAYLYVEVTPAQGTFYHYPFVIMQYGMQSAVNWEDECGNTMYNINISESKVYRVSATDETSFALDLNKKFEIRDQENYNFTTLATFNSTGSAELAKALGVSYYFDKTPPQGAINMVYNSDLNLTAWTEDNQFFIQWIPLEPTNISSIGTIQIIQDNLVKNVYGMRSSEESADSEYYGYITTPVTFKIDEKDNCIYFNAQCNFEIEVDSVRYTLNNGVNCTSPVYRGTYYGDKMPTGDTDDMTVVINGVTAQITIWSENNIPYMRWTRGSGPLTTALESGYNYSIVQDNIAGAPVSAKLCSEDEAWSTPFFDSRTFQLGSDEFEDFILNGDRTFKIYSNDYSDSIDYTPSIANPTPAKAWILNKDVSSIADCMDVSSSSGTQSATYCLWYEDSTYFLNVTPNQIYTPADPYYLPWGIDMVQNGQASDLTVSTRADESSMHPYFGGIVGPVTFRLFFKWGYYGEDGSTKDSTMLVDTIESKLNYDSIQAKKSGISPAIIMYLLN